MFITYILKSKIAKKTYVGYTSDLKKRLQQHNDGITIFSKRYKPWYIIYQEAFTDQINAIRREKYFKSAAGRRWMKKNLFS